MRQNCCPREVTRLFVIYRSRSQEGLVLLAETVCITQHPFHQVVRQSINEFVRSAAGATFVDLPGELASTEQFVRTIEVIIPESVGSLQITSPEIPGNIPPKPHYITRNFSDWNTTSLLEGVRKTVEFYR